MQASAYYFRLAFVALTILVMSYAQVASAQQSPSLDFDYPFENNENPGSYFGMRQALIEISPRDQILRALNADCQQRPEGPCDDATMFVVSDAIVKAAAQQAEIKVGRVLLPDLPEADEYAEEAMAGLAREIEIYLQSGSENAFGYPSKRTGTVTTICGELEYTYSTIVVSSIDREADGSLADYADVEVTTNFSLHGSCDCQEINGQQVGAIDYWYQSVQDIALNTGDAIELTAGINECWNLSSCNCAVEAQADAFPGTETYVLNFDSPFWCTYGGGQVQLFPPGASMPATTPVPSPLVPPPVSPGATTPTPSPLAPVPAGEEPPETPGGTIVPGTVFPFEDIVTTEFPDVARTPTPAGPIPIPYPYSGQSGDSGTVTVPPPSPDSPTANGEAEQPNQSPPTTTLTIKATQATLTAGQSVAAAGALIQLNTGTPALAGDPDAERDDSGSGQGELSGTADEEGNVIIDISTLGVTLAAGADYVEVEVNPSTGTVLGFPGNVSPADVLPPELVTFAQPTFSLGGTTFIPLLIPEYLAAGLQTAVDGSGATSVEPDFCVDPKPLYDPYFSSTGTWKQPYADQWGIRSIGFTDDEDSAWKQVPADAAPVTIAVIDSGIDWNHLEIDWNVLWRNEGEIAGNNVDDDKNGYVDDTIGWDFWDNDRTPWDNDGHGTFVAGVMFANPGNQEGIAGISRNAKLMVLKAMNAFGHSRASRIAEAIKYAADNGARVINLSLGGPGTSTVVRDAIQYAYDSGAVVVVAAGNEAKPAEDQVVSGVPNALTVAATGVNNERSIYSNYGAGIDLAAPGDDILSLRARRTDLLKNIPDVDYAAEAAFVGDDRRYYRASGTSFATPMVSGVAGLVLAKNPELTPAQVIRVLKQSARDVGKPGVDHFTGYGIVDALAALRAEPDYYVEAQISGVGVVVENNQQLLTIVGTADADRFEKATIFVGKGENPDDWTEVSSRASPVVEAALGSIPATTFAGATQWTIRLVTAHADGSTREFWFLLTLG